MMVDLSASNVQSGRLEEQWAESAAVLLLRPVQDQRGYEAPLFESELAECTFVEYPIDTWSKATLAAAPLFSASWQAAALLSQSMGTSSLELPGARASMPQLSTQGAQVTRHGKPSARVQSIC
jgi:hypothetical protein